jgi:CRP-like cAMP-binding protein
MMKLKKVNINGIVYKEGMPSTHIYIVKSGEFEMTRNHQCVAKVQDYK